MAISSGDSNGSSAVKYLKGNVGSVAIGLLLVYCCVLILTEVNTRYFNYDPQAAKRSKDGAGPGRDHLADEAMPCRHSVYDWEREDSRHAKVLAARRQFYKELQIGKHRKGGPASAEGLQTLVLHGFQVSTSCADIQRFGGVADGGKVLCEARRLLDSDDCLVYSFGVGYNCDFEMELLAEFPRCSIHMFDPSTAMKGFIAKHCSLPQIHFYPWGLRGDAVLPDGNIAPPVPKMAGEREDVPMAPLRTNQTGFYSLPRLQAELGHVGRKIHLLKMDIEGGEFDSLLYLMAPQNKAIMFNTNLLALELHQAPTGYQERLVSELEVNDMRLYYSERNAYFPATLAEIAFLNSTALREIDTGGAKV